jgi:hypothetical protein
MEGIKMIGVLLNGKEIKEIEYLLKREMDEILYDLTDDRIAFSLKKSMEERYKILFSLFTRVAPPTECMKYMRTTPKNNKQQVNIVEKNL